MVRACWNELFTLGLAQCAHEMNLSTILAAIINHLQSSIQEGTAHGRHLSVGHTRTIETACCRFFNVLRHERLNLDLEGIVTNLIKVMAATSTIITRLIQFWWSKVTVT